MRVLWFANTPGLSQHHLNNKISGGGWISSLQSAVENSSGIELGFVFYHDGVLTPFTGGKTHYYPVRKIGFSKKKRMLHRITRKTEYQENLADFLRIVKDFRPDIIHVHGTENSFGLIVNHIQDIPIVISIQGNLTVYAHKYFAGMDMPGLIRQLRAGYPFFGADYSIWQKRARIEQEILQKTKYVFGRTDWDRRISLVMAPEARYFHVDEVMREQFYHVKWEPLPSGVPVFLTTCSPSLYKGFETIIDTAKILVNNQFQFTWLVAGLREEDALVRLVKKSKGVNRLEDLNIRLTGLLSGEELANRLVKANVYVQVSHIENSPNSLCEAMLAGMPVIASFAGGTGSLVQDGVNGTLVQNGDPFVLAGGLMEMIRNPEDSLRMAREGARTAHLKHDARTVVDQLLAGYSAIIREHYGHQPGDLPLIHQLSVNG